MSSPPFYALPWAVEGPSSDNVPLAALRAIEFTSFFKVDGYTWITAGSPGYLIKPSMPGFSLVQAHNRQGGVSTFDVPNSKFKRGKLHSEFSVEMPLATCSLRNVSMGFARAGDPLGKVITQLWANIAENRDAFDTLGMVSVGRIVDTGHLPRMVQALIGSFDDQAWRVLNSSDFKANPLKSLLTLPAVGISNVRIQDEYIRIYSRLYHTGSRANPDPNFAKYGGMSTNLLEHRNTAHRAAMNSPDKEGYNTPHYRMARSIGKNGKTVAAVMSCLIKIRRTGDDWKFLTTMAETTACCILRSFHPGVFEAAGKTSKRQYSHAVSSADMPSTVLMCNIADEVMDGCAYPKMGGHGCNWALPMGQYMSEAHPWIRRDIAGHEGKMLTIYRTVITLQAPSQTETGAVGVRLSGKPVESTTWLEARGWHFYIYIADIIAEYKLTLGTPLFLVVEVAHNGFHPSPYSRLPCFGAFDNSHRLPSVGIRVEWLDTAKQQWLTRYLMDRDMTNGYNPRRGWGGGSKLPDRLAAFEPKPHILSGWRRVTLLLQALEERRYTNPPPYLFHEFRMNMREVHYDHLEQRVTYRRRQPVTSPSPQTVPYYVNHDRIMRMVDSPTIDRWWGLRPGERPDQEWFVTASEFKAGGKFTEPRCVICKRDMNISHADRESCSKRLGDFEIAPDEIDKKEIKANSCKRCWTLLRSPCVWAPGRFWLPRATPDGSKLPEGTMEDHFDGCAFLFKKEYPTVPIPAPMTEQEYFGHTQTMLDADARGETMDKKVIED